MCFARCFSVLSCLTELSVNCTWILAGIELRQGERKERQEEACLLLCGDLEEGFHIWRHCFGRLRMEAVWWGWIQWGSPRSRWPRWPTEAFLLPGLTRVAEESRERTIWLGLRARSPTSSLLIFFFIWRFPLAVGFSVLWTDSQVKCSLVSAGENDVSVWPGPFHMP